MYESYWKLKEKPFKNTPDPRFLYFSEQHKDAFMKLMYAVTEGMGAAMMTGVFGCGKTLLGKALFNELESKYKIAFINNPQVPSNELLRAIVRNLKSIALPDKKSELMSDALLEILNKVLTDNMRDGKETVIIVDEAHIIEDEKIFETLRLLLNFQENNKFLLTLLLFGQPELKGKVDNLKQFEQRLALRCHLDTLDLDDTEKYILYRLKVAGLEKKIFAKDAVKLIYDQSGGIPRRINRICDLSLLTGFGKKTKKINASIVKDSSLNFGG
jgi:type II secretory pathway predicted ATPase ExeA